jgi:hypothetical protein
VKRLGLTIVKKACGILSAGYRLGDKQKLTGIDAEAEDSVYLHRFIAA